MADAISWAYLLHGNDYLDEAEQKSGEEADRLFAQAGEKYAAALAIKNDDHLTLNAWGVCLLLHYRVVAKERREIMLRRAIELLLGAEAIVNGYASYNLACAYSLA